MVQRPRLDVAQVAHRYLPRKPARRPTDLPVLVEMPEEVPYIRVACLDPPLAVVRIGIGTPTPSMRPSPSTIACASQSISAAHRTSSSASVAAGSPASHARISWTPWTFDFLPLPLSPGGAGRPTSGGMNYASLRRVKSRRALRANS
jgi:hypothetical protein